MTRRPSTPATSPGDNRDAPRCLWCDCVIDGAGRRYCSDRHRKRAWKARQLAVTEDLGDVPKRLAYADPPFIGLAAKYYRDQPTFDGEVDHVRLLEQLATFDGWALSCSRDSLPCILSLIPRGDGRPRVYICPWIKTHHPPKARGPSNIHEYLVVKPARRRLPGVPDALVLGASRGAEEKLVGRKPVGFVMWMFALLGALPTDELVDLFPGTGVVGRCWRQFRLLHQVGTGVARSRSGRRPGTAVTARRPGPRETSRRSAPSPTPACDEVSA